MQERIKDRVTTNVKTFIFDGGGGDDSHSSDDVKNQIDDLKKQIDDAKDKASKTKDQELFNALSERIEQLTKQLNYLLELEKKRAERDEEEIIKQMSEAERLRHLLEKKEKEIEEVKKSLEEAFSKKAEELELKLKQYEDERKRLAQAAAKAKALEAAARLGAYNPEQVYALIRDNLVTGDDGNVYIRYMDDTGNYKQIPVDEYLKDFLNRPENKNLLKTNAAVGDKEPPKVEGSAPKSTTTSSNDFEAILKKMSAAERAKLEEEAVKYGLPLEAYLYIQQAKKKAAQRYYERHKIKPPRSSFLS